MFTLPYSSNLTNYLSRNAHHENIKPHFYIVKLGFTGYTLFFVFLLKNIDCGNSLEPPRRGGGYSLKPPRRGGSNEYPQSMFCAEI